MEHVSVKASHPKAYPVLKSTKVERHKNPAVLSHKNSKAVDVMMPKINMSTEEDLSYLTQLYVCISHFC